MHNSDLILTQQGFKIYCFETLKYIKYGCFKLYKLYARFSSYFSNVSLIVKYISFVLHK
jgi:hypothetical protein